MNKEVPDDSSKGAGYTEPPFERRPELFPYKQNKKR